MKNVTNVPNCTGCGACYNACPKGAITMECRRTKFYAPLVDESLCIKCSKCVKVCPALDYRSQNGLPDTYAVAAPDAEAVQSTSGGAFVVLAKYVLSQGGVVCGVAWNEQWEAQHIIVDNEEDLQKLRISKYVQAHTAGVFKEIRSLLKTGRMVLFSGSPCQNAGLLNYLGKEYENLLTVDHLCHGAPSPFVWQEYLDANYDREHITDIKFRAVGSDWTKGCRASADDIRQGYIMVGNQRKEIGAYTHAFLNHVLSNEACLDCKFKYIPRPADFTMGDFWYYSKYVPEYPAHKGLSVFLCNNGKARRHFERFSSAFKLCRQVDLHGEWGDIEITESTRRTDSRALFFRDYGRFPLNRHMAAAAKRHYDIAFAGMFNGWNYGSALVSYAAQSILNNMGYTVVMINKRRYPELDLGPENRSLRFARSHCHISRQFECGEDASELNELADTFIVGSDTNWWWADAQSSRYFYWLDFVRTGKRKIAFATSFAHERPDIPAAQTPHLKYLYSRFDAVSVREESGVRNLAEIYGIRGAEHIIDPVLIADDSVFHGLAGESSRKESGYVFAYILDPTPEKDKLLKDVANRMGLELRAVPGMTVKNPTALYNECTPEIVDFVYLVKHAAFVVTDSFHGTCFSIIFQRPFVSLVNEWRGAARYQLFHDMGLSARLVCHPAEVLECLDSFAQLPDFSLANQIRETESKKAYAWLKKALECTPKVSETDLLYDCWYVRYMDTVRQQPEYKRVFRKIKKAIRRRLPSFIYPLMSKAWRFLRSRI